MRTGNFALKMPQMREAARLYAEGWSAQQLAERFHVHKSTMQDSLKYMGVKPRTPQEGRIAARNSTYRTYMAERRRPPLPLSQAVNQWRTQ